MEFALAGRSILVVEDEPLIALDIKAALEDHGAKVTVAHTLREALRAVEDPDLAAAVLDHALSDGDSSAICERLNERDIPFVTFSGYDHLDGACSEGVHVTKPAKLSTLVDTVEALLGPQAAATS